jgi:uncharacterized protein (TIGR01777 family)
MGGAADVLIALQARTTMKVVIAGGTGFLGRALAAAVAAAGHTVVVLTRAAQPASPRGLVRYAAWTPENEAGAWSAELDGAGAVVNLAGESIAARRWTSARKARIVDSRVRATRSLVVAMRRAPTPPPVLISGSAVGYYGPLGDEIVTEAAGAGSDFLAGVCAQWEAAAESSASDRTRIVRLRTGIVLERDGGALPRMLPPFWFGAGGPIGSGRQYWPWIHRDDWVALVRWAIDTPAVAGALNATAPTPVTSREFAGALGRAIHRPALLPAPAVAMKLLLGEMAEGLLLSGQRAVPDKAVRAGYAFRYAFVDDALHALFSTRRASAARP